MSRISALLAIAYVGWLGGAACKSSSEGAAKTKEAAPCAASFAALPDHDKPGTTTTCACDAASTSRGSVWGTGPYTQDSSICAAAAHAGVIPAAGGVVVVKASPGCPSYAGSTANGVRSDSWGSFPGSFTFEGKSAECAPVAAAAPPPPPCPAAYNKLAGFDQPGEKACSCTPDISKGSVWGVGPYTQDSSICAAAVHAGVIPPDGGVVRVVTSPGCPAYPGDARNGITSGSWGSFPASFSFAGKDSACKG